MILERLIIENFRQFKGRHELIFSDLHERNVTIVHAENGFGKTTLLKALLWGLYGRDGLLGTDGNPDDFEIPDRIINESLERESQDPNKISATVTITFKHHTQRFILTRQLTLAQQNINPKQTFLTLEVMQDGQTFKAERPQPKIESIIPEGISRFLFFNGERINYLAMEQNRSQVTEAIQQMLGLKLLKVTIKDLMHQSVRGRLRAEQKENTSSEKRMYIDQLSNLDNQIDELVEKKKQLDDNLASLKKEHEMIDNKLAQNREAQELQSKRVRLDQENEELVKRRNELEFNIKKFISEDGYSLFAMDLLEKGKELVTHFRAEGRIPARVLNTFLQEILECGKCICQRDLIKNSPEYEAVEKLLTIAGDQDFNNAVGSLDHVIGHLETMIAQSSEKFDQLKKERLEVITEIRNIGEEIEEIHQKIGSKKDEEVQQLEEKRKKILLDIESNQADRGRTDTKIDDTKEQAESLRKKIRQIEDREEAAAVAQRRVDAVEDCADLLSKILEAETQSLRPMLNNKINEFFRKIMTKDYWAELTEDYTLRIRKKVAGTSTDSNGSEIDAALSTGERTVTSLVFIASLVALAKERSEIPTILKGLSGSEYPVAIDSPFGSLSIFRRDVARYIPELAPQVLLFVSPEQYDGQVEEALAESKRVGKRYYLAYHGPTMPDRANPELVIHGKEIQQYFPTDTEEFTEVREL